MALERTDRVLRLFNVALKHAPEERAAFMHTLRATVLVLLLLVLAGCTNGADPNDTAPAVYVGGAACTGCHTDQAALWQGSHHDLAMQEATDTTVLGDFDDAAFTYGGVTSTFVRRDSAFVVRTDGPDGALQDFEIAYTFGVDPLQQYLVAFPGGRYQALPIAWDTRPADAGGQRWFHLYPDEAVTHDDPLHWTGRYLNWNYMCADCHSTNLDRHFSIDANRYNTSWTDLDVNCEACHGPGSAHVDWAEAVASGDQPSTPDADLRLTVRLTNTDGGAWIMDPATGIARRTVERTTTTRVETCAPCHARRTMLSDDFRPGRPLLDAYRPVTLDAGLYHADGQIFDEVYVYGSFVQSKMFRAGVTCSDCHNPHSLGLRAEGNGVCASCHLPARFDTPEHHFHSEGSTGAACVACHMPSRTYMVVDPRRDHSLRVPRPDLSETLGTPNACTGCHTDRSASWAAQTTETWYGPPDDTLHYGEVLAAGRSGDLAAEPSLAALAANTDRPGIVRATALNLLRARPGPSTFGAVQQALTDPDPLVRYAALNVLDVVPPETRAPLALPLLADSARAVRTEAARVLAPVPAHMLPPNDLRRVDRGLDEYRAAERVNDDRPDAHMNLGLLAVARGELEAAEAAYRDALRLDSAYVPAFVNLADLYRLRGYEMESARVLEEGLARAPEAAELHHALGLHLVRQQRLPEAVEALAEAAALRPEEARYSYVYGVALHTTGDTDEALDVLAAAQTRHPFDRDLLSALATIHRDAGSLTAALDYARTLAALSPNDQGARQLVAQLEAAQENGGIRSPGRV